MSSYSGLHQDVISQLKRLMKLSKYRVMSVCQSKRAYPLELRKLFEAVCDGHRRIACRSYMTSCSYTYRVQTQGREQKGFIVAKTE